MTPETWWGRGGVFLGADRAAHAPRGLPLLALLGTIGLGTQVSAVVAVAGGARATRSFRWIGAGTVLWSVVAVVATTTGVELLGVGG